MELEHEESSRTLTVQQAGVLRKFLLPLDKQKHRCLVGRKDLQEKSVTADHFEQVHKAIFPALPRLSTEQVLVTVTQRDLSVPAGLLAKILGRNMNQDTVDIILSFLVSGTQVAIQDLGSAGGTFLAINRPLAAENFWLVGSASGTQGRDSDRFQEARESVAICFISSPQERTQVPADCQLVDYIQNSTVRCDDPALLRRALNCRSDRKEVEGVTRRILEKYAVVVLSHQGVGYTFIVDKDQHSIGIGGLFEGRVRNGLLEVRSQLQVFSNICRERGLRNYRHSEVHCVRSEEWVMMGDQLFRICVN